MYMRLLWQGHSRFVAHIADSKTAKYAAKEPMCANTLAKVSAYTHDCCPLNAKMVIMRKSIMYYSVDNNIINTKL